MVRFVRTLSSLQQILFQLHVQMFYTKCIFQDIIMNFVGTVMFVAVGGVALHYWTGYQTEHKYVTLSSEKQVGIAVGSLCIVEGAIYLLDTVLSCIHFAKDYDLKWKNFAVWSERLVFYKQSQKKDKVVFFSKCNDNLWFGAMWKVGVKSSMPGYVRRWTISLWNKLQTVSF